MKRLLLAGTIVCVGALIFASQRQRRSVLEKQNVQLVAMADTLRKRSEESARAQALAEEKVGPLQLALATQKASSSEVRADTPPPSVPVPPDPTRQGGWPPNTDYFYLPKKFLQQASFQVLNQQQLSDEAASLFNLTEPERHEANRAIAELFAQLRRAETERMQLVEMPPEWPRGEFNSGVAYHIPSFSSEVTAWRQNLQQRLEAVMGSERSALLGSGIEGLLREDWNDLGENERTVGFVWKPEQGGTSSLWLATKDVRYGDGTFRRHLPGGPDEASFRHYADLFGIELPKP